MSKEAEWVRDTGEALDDCDILLLALQDGQIGLQGYIITGDDKLLETYQAVRPRVETAMNRLRASCTPSTEQQKRLNELQPLLDEQLDTFDRLIEIRSLGLTSAVQAIKTEKAKGVSKHIATLVADLKSEEEQQLQSREDRARGGTRQTIVLILLGSLLAAGVVIIAEWVIQRDLVRRKQIEAELRSSYELLDQRVRERTAELVMANENAQRQVVERDQAVQAMKESEERFRQVIENIDQVFWITSADKSAMLFINTGYERIWGRKCEDLYASPMSWVDAIHPEDRARIREAAMRQQADEMYDVEYRITRPDGTMRWIHDRGFPIRNAGVIDRIAGLCEDITARKETEQFIRQKEEQLHEADRRLATIVQSMTEACFALDNEWRFTFANARCETLFHVPREGMIGRLLWEVFPKIAGTWMEKEMRESMHARMPVSFESFSPVALCWIEVRIFPAGDGLAAFVLDIHERKQAESALLDSERRLAGMVGSAMDAIITVNEEQRIELFNSAAEKMFGCSAAETIGTTIDRFIPKPLQEVQRHPRFDETEHMDHVNGAFGPLNAIRSSGEEFPIEASISQIEVSGRKLFTIILRDVTERLRSDQALTVRNRQQEALADIGQHALEGRDLEQLFKDAVSLIPQILDVEFCELLELQPDGKALLLRAGSGWKPGFVQNCTVGAGLESQAGYTLESNSPVFVDDFAGETRFQIPTLLQEHGVASGLTVVIAGRGGPFGVLGAHSKRPQKHSIVDVHFVQSVATMLAAAIERHELEDELLHISDEEQRRIGRDLHDGLCQHLAGIEFRTEALARDLENNPEICDEVTKIGTLIRSGTRQARMLSRGLTPVEVEANGLMSALNELAASSAQLFPVECHFLCDEPVLLADHVAATHLYRIAQEAISNAVRHARAKVIDISLQIHGDDTVLMITNDGLSLPTEPVRPGGMGLRIMRYRAEMIGATLRISSTAEGKTAVICSFRVDQ